MAVCQPSQLQRYRSGTEIESTESVNWPGKAGRSLPSRKPWACIGRPCRSMSGGWFHIDGPRAVFWIRTSPISSPAGMLGIGPGRSSGRKSNSKGIAGNARPCCATLAACVKLPAWRRARGRLSSPRPSWTRMLDRGLHGRQPGLCSVILRRALTVMPRSCRVSVNLLLSWQKRSR